MSPSVIIRSPGCLILGFEGIYVNYIIPCRIHNTRTPHHSLLQLACHFVRWMDRKRANTGSSSLTERDSLLATDTNSSGSTERTSFYAATCHSPVDAASTDMSVEELECVQHAPSISHLISRLLTIWLCNSEAHDCQSPTLLENSNSVARDHLASERTFLAYVRTSLAVVSAGVGKLHGCFAVPSNL